MEQVIFITNKEYLKEAFREVLKEERTAAFRPRIPTLPPPDAKHCHPSRIIDFTMLP